MGRTCGIITGYEGTVASHYLEKIDEDYYGRRYLRRSLIARVAPSVPLLRIGEANLDMSWLCKDELAAYLKKGDNVCIYWFTHLLRKKIIIGIRSETGPSWLMSFPRFATTFLMYYTFWPIFVGICSVLLLGVPPMVFGLNQLSNIGFWAGIACGIVLSGLSGIRLMLAWRRMRADRLVKFGGPSLASAAKGNPLGLIAKLGIGSVVGVVVGVLFAGFLGDDVPPTAGITLVAPIGAGLGFLAWVFGRKK